jgi:hypothetical protein
VEVLVRCGYRCSRGSSTLVLVRGAEWRFAFSSSASLLLSACRGGEGKKESSRRQETGSIFIKRGFRATLYAVPIPVCLAGRGGMEVNWAGATVPMLVLCLWRTLENSPLMAISKRRPELVPAIFGQMAGLAMLTTQDCVSFYFLQARIFYSYGLAPKPPTQPSGFIPGCGWGGVALSLPNTGGLQGPDCVSAIFFRVCSISFKGLVVISYFFLGPPCKFTPTARMNSPGPLGPYLFKKIVV